MTENWKSVAPEIAAERERDRLKVINAELLAALAPLAKIADFVTFPMSASDVGLWTQQRSHGPGHTQTFQHAIDARAAIARATGETL